MTSSVDVEKRQMKPLTTLSYRKLCRCIHFFTWCLNVSLFHSIFCVYWRESLTISKASDTTNCTVQLHKLSYKENPYFLSIIIQCYLIFTIFSFYTQEEECSFLCPDSVCWLKHFTVFTFVRIQPEALWNVSLLTLVSHSKTAFLWPPLLSRV